MSVMPESMEPLPRDPRVPLLAGDSEASMQDLLARAGLEEPVLERYVLRHRPGRRFVVRVDTTERSVAVKAYGGKLPERQLNALASLRRQGLASGVAPTVPPPLLVDHECAAVVSDWLQGPSATELIASGRGARAAELAVKWLLAAARSEAVSGRGYGPRDLLPRARRWVRLIGDADAELGRIAGEILARLTASTPAEGRPRLVHGELSPSHVLDLGGGPGIVDWDTFGSGPLEADVAMFVTAALHGRGLEADRRIQAELAARRLLEEVSELLDRDTLAWYRTAAALQLAKPYARRCPPGWREAVHIRLSCAFAPDAFRLTIQEDT
jgi:aminoglycoside phosphotransferase (APT) family kinase protein